MNHLNQRKTARVLFDEYHNEAWSIDETTARAMNPNHAADSSYAKAAYELARRDFIVARNFDQPLIATLLDHHDMLVIAHPSDERWEHTATRNAPVFTDTEIDAIDDFVRNGGGLVVMGETEQDKYGNNVNTLLQRFGVKIENATLTDHTHCDNKVPSWVFADLSQSITRNEFNLTEQVRQACFLRAGVVSANGNGAQVAMRAHDTASISRAGLVAVAQHGKGRVVVFADSDLFGDDDLYNFDHLQLWLNVAYAASHLAFGQLSTQPLQGSEPCEGFSNDSWQRLKSSTNELRRLQQKDGSLAPDASKENARQFVREMQGAIAQLKSHFSHQGDYLDCVLKDLDDWMNGGFIKPDFAKSLAAFRPDLQRKNNIEHLVVFPLYTPNGSPETRFESLIVRVPWMDWLAELERTRFDNAKFVPVTMIDNTDGYNSECAVLFPETVSLVGKPTNNFGGIFCDREAKRYRRTVSAAIDLMKVNAPPQLKTFLQSPQLVQDMFVLWDLIHDRWHSHGELPFDPFMIRQRLPYWMYTLEELRVDLQTYGSACELEQEGFAFARYVKYGILFDRIFRFPITGNRVRNYDGLGGQLLFAFLHKNNIAVWRDNEMTIDWERLDDAVAQLRAQIEKLYRDGIDMTKVQYWIAAHDLISEWVKPNLGSQWAKETRVVSDENDPKAWINRVLDDEFPLSLFYQQLQKKLQNANAI
jgi:hypothetical protein